MNSYTIETVLETREPGVIELFGNAPGVVHKVSGVLHLHVDKTIHLKELSVVFLCEAVVGYNSPIISTSSDPMTIYKNQFDALHSTSSPSNTPTEFLPGAYTFPFQISIPSELSTTDSTKLISQEFIWMYHLTTTAVPASITKGTTFSSLFQKRKTIHMPLVLRKAVIDPSSGNSVRCSAGRKDGEEEFRVAIFVPAVINVTQTIVPIMVQMKAIGGRGENGGKGRFWVKEIQAQAMQTEKIIHNSPEAFQSMEGLRRVIPTGIFTDPEASPRAIKKAAAALSNTSSTTTTTTTSSSASGTPTHHKTPHSVINTTHTKLISSLVTVPNPNQYLPGSFATPDQYSHTFELDLTAGEEKGNGGREVLPSETLPWVQISHAVRFKVVFEGEEREGGQKPLVVKAPLKVAFICQRENINLASGRPLLQVQTQGEREGGNVAGGDDWMFAESAPGYEVDGVNGGGEDGTGAGGRGEDVLPGYGDDVGRANLLDSNVRGNHGLQVK
ncbi:hypothetical protein BGZ95_005183 [Linnemannia exigua]|uniref:Uncharacterized protein n=1 Tax=Linnemannia exigua TaxID=604196 RepID=A0AAD4D2J2_9FUNG|nr:hypothetical protein BGZ95_005183 [Linnemannia exigua]